MMIVTTVNPHKSRMGIENRNSQRDWNRNTLPEIAAIRKHFPYTNKNCFRILIFRNVWQALRKPSIRGVTRSSEHGSPFASFLSETFLYYSAFSPIISEATRKKSVPFWTLK